MFKELNEEIRNLKSDLINNKIVDSKSEYHEWITINKKYIFQICYVLGIVLKNGRTTTPIDP